MNKPVYIVAAKRTPVGAFLGALSSVPATELGSIALKAAIEQSGLKPEHIEELFIGNVVSANLGQAPAKQVALGAGLPNSIPTTQINKVCASGAKSIMIGAAQIMLGERNVVAVGGMESMSRTPHYLTEYRSGFKYGGGKVLDGIQRDALQDAYDQTFMGECGELCAEKYNFSREEQDAFAVESYKRAEKAMASGKFDAELTPVVVKGRKGDTTVSQDEEPGNVRYEKIPHLRPAFKKDGTITAANASKLNDGATALILASEEAVQQHGLKPLAKIASFADAAVEPKWFTIAPADALPIALKKAGKSVEEIDLFEINEAFAVVAMANAKLLNIPHEKLNIYGGAVALGHPVGNSGARLIATLVYALHQEGKQWGAMGICNGGGGASAMVIEKV